MPIRSEFSMRYQFQRRVCVRCRTFFWIKLCYLIKKQPATICGVGCSVAEIQVICDDKGKIALPPLCNPAHMLFRASENPLIQSTLPPQNYCKPWSMQIRHEHNIIIRNEISGDLQYKHCVEWSLWLFRDLKRNSIHCLFLLLLRREAS